MNTSKMNGDAIRKILQPIKAILSERQKALNQFMRLSLYSTSEMQRLPELVSFVGKASSLRQPSMSAEFQHAEDFAGIARAEEAAGFATLFNFATIFTWGALETAIHDTAVNWLMYVPEARRQERVLRLKIPFIEYDELQPDERMRFVLHTLENDLGATFKPGISKFESVLKEIDLGGSVDEEIKKDLFEMASVRNVLVHKAGISDQRFVDACHWYGAAVGETVSVNAVRYGRYRRQVMEYAQIVMIRVMERFDLVPTPGELDELRSAVTT